MKRIIIINEGETEKEFCKDVLQPYFFAQNILIQHPTIKKSGGGIVAWETLKKQIETHLKQDPSVFVTTLIDYYGLNGEKLKFPNWQEAQNIVDLNKKITFLEQSMKVLVDDSLRYRLIVGYNKPVYGSILAETIGLERIRSKCPRFNNWINTLETI